MEFVTSLLKVQNKDYIFVVVDHLTKYAHFMAMSSDFKAPQIADMFFKEVCRLNGPPRNIVSDRDNHFLNLFWQELFRLTGT